MVESTKPGNEENAFSPLLLTLDDFSEFQDNFHFKLRLHKIFFAFPSKKITYFSSLDSKFYFHSSISYLNPITPFLPYNEIIATTACSLLNEQFFVLVSHLSKMFNHLHKQATSGETRNVVISCATNRLFFAYNR